ncbi:hypothetical protein OCGS_1592 [Oceaniovalibus guishaninsula JLT2003]|uniref:DUF306 domain-containing protein n=1 Tax=Oceaniovalibus guishaninsula JLT2003 TaxID=1231392 RepID=K2GN36_9RHOB|nr:META domain-containing protein [Oceaniovalibus guishaninsula]EKE44076.1 hypothetical protein OCGS_1592 [Oceaniovalibus guishaninsula JLT2003]
MRARNAALSTAIAVTALSACAPEPSVSALVDPGIAYALVSIEGRPFPATATLTFPASDRVAGQGPCNSFDAQQTAPYPFIEIGPLRTTRMACPDIEAEMLYFGALDAVTVVEAAGPQLVLNAPGGPRMVFQAEN